MSKDILLERFGEPLDSNQLISKKKKTISEVGRNDYSVSTAVTAHPRTSYKPSSASWEEYKTYKEKDDEEDDETRPMQYGAMTYEQIGNELGLSISGAKKVIDQVVGKLKFINSMFPTKEKRDAWVLNTVKRYVEYLDTSNELTDEEYLLLRNTMEEHPDLITQLDGFQKFLADELKDAGFNESRNNSTSLVEKKKKNWATSKSTAKKTAKSVAKKYGKGFAGKVKWAKAWGADDPEAVAGALSKKIED